MDSLRTSSPKQLMGPLAWIFFIIGTPILAVWVHLRAELLYPVVSDEIGVLVLAGWAVIHLFYMVMIYRSFEGKITSLVAAEEGKKDVGPNKTAAAISLSVVSGLTLILVLLIFNYYGHDRAANYAAAKEGSSEGAKQDKFDRNANSVVGVNSGGGAKIQASNLQSDSNNSIVARPNFLEKSGGFLGTFGDFFGGVVNPILTFGSLVALAITILMQRTQLSVAERNTKKNADLLEKQTFETTFFNMLGLHNSTVRDLKFDPSSVQIPIWYNDPDYTFGVAQEGEENSEEGEGLGGVDILFGYVGEPDLLLAPVVLDNADGRQVFARVLELMDSYDHESTPSAVYHRIQKYHNYVLGHYFRTLYQVLELVDEYSETAGYDAATRYSSIIRAQLSANELILLYYNCSYELVDTGQFRRLLKRYEILEHMPLHFARESGLLSTPGYTFDLNKHVSQYFRGPEDANRVYSEAGAFGKNPVIFDYRKYQT